jgi:hypothetical protein
VFFPKGHPLFRFCDAPLHWDCYEDWPERLRFARQSVDSHVDHLYDDEEWGFAVRTELVNLTVRKKEPGLVNLWLLETGTCVEVLLSDWSSWLSDLTLTKRRLHRLETTSLWKVLPALRQRFPTSQAVLATVDWDAKEQLAEAKKEVRVSRQRAWLADLEAHNAACRQFFSAHGPQGMTCPHCRRQSTHIQFVDRAADERKSFFLCLSCGRSFGHEL